MRLLLAAQVKMLSRDRQSLFWALVFPIIFLTVFRLFSFDSLSATTLTLGGEAASPVGQAVATALGDLEFIELTVQPGVDAEAAEALLDGGDADVVLLIAAPGGGRAASAEMVHALDDPLAVSTITAVLESVVDRVNIALSGRPRLIEFSSRATGAFVPTFFEFLAPGIIGMGLMTFSTISLAGALARYREEGVLRRLRATPLPPWRFFAAVVVSYLLVALVQVVVLTVYAELLGAHVLGAIAWLVPIALLGNLVFLNIGVVIAGVVEGRYAVEGAANAVTLPMMFLSGTFFPTDTLPAIVERAVQVLPLTQLLRALRHVALGGESMWAQWPELLVLLGWIIGTFVVATRVFRLEDA